MELQTTHLQAGNPLSTTENLIALLKSEDHETRLRLAENKACPSDVLTKLSTDIDPDVRAAVAGNPSAPQHVVNLLSNDTHDDVRFLMASDPHLPLEILHKLSQDQNPYVSDRAHKTIAGVALELALEEQGFVSLPSIHARLGELLVASRIIDEKELETYLMLATCMKIPLGQALVRPGRVSGSIIVYALKQQTMVRLGQITLEMAVKEISTYASRQQSCINS